MDLAGAPHRDGGAGVTIWSRVRPWLELARVSNLATCVSNTMTGIALGLAARIPPGDPDGEIAGSALRPPDPNVGAFRWDILATAAPGIIALYIAGMILNDLVDASTDSTERPGRPIPSGRISRRDAGIALGFCVLVASGTLAFLSIPAAIAAGSLLCFIVAYDILHQKSETTVLLLGICRALIYAVAAAATAWPLEPLPLAVFGSALLLYVVGLSVIARVEAEHSVERSGLGGRRFASLLLLIPPFLPLLIARPEQGWAPLFVTGLCLMLWLQYAASALLSTPPRIGRAVAAWIAGICLVDAVFLSILDRPIPALVAVGCFTLTVLAQRRIPAT